MDQSSSKSASNEGVRVEQSKVFGLFAHADVFHRQSHLLTDCDDHAPLGRAVELRQDDARTLDGIGKVLGLADSVLAGRRVEHQQDFVRRFGDHFSQDAVNLGQLLHQVLLRLEPAGRIDDGRVCLDLQGPRGRPVRNGRRIASLLSLDDFDAEPLRPDRQLRDCAGRKVSAAPRITFFPSA